MYSPIPRQSLFLPLNCYLMSRGVVNLCDPVLHAHDYLRPRIFLSSGCSAEVKACSFTRSMRHHTISCVQALSPIQMLQFATFIHTKGLGRFTTVQDPDLLVLDKDGGIGCTSRE